VLNVKSSRQGSQSCLIRQQVFWLDLVSQGTVHQNKILDKSEALLQQRIELLEWYVGVLAGRKTVWIS